MTIYDISEKAGVSIATVSRVLNGNANVKPKTKKKVMDVIEEYGYTPNAFARGLGLNTMNTIGILCADSSDLYLAKAVYYIEQLLRENGVDIVCSALAKDSEPLGTFSPVSPFVLFIGGEKRGISPCFMEAADKIVHIPYMRENVRYSLPTATVCAMFAERLAERKPLH